MWSISLQGDPAFNFLFPLDGHTTNTCDLSGPSVVSVAFRAPPTAVPGDAFDVVVTVHSNDGSFRDGKVKVHAVIVVPRIAVDKTAIDFGDVPLGTKPAIPLNFDGQVAVSIQPDGLVKPPFFLGGGGSMVSGSVRWTFVVEAGADQLFGAGPGDYTSSFAWSAPALPSGLPAACLWTTTTTVHARVLDVDGGDASSDVDALNDGAADGAPNAP
jgi:hypothetical protein